MLDDDKKKDLEDLNKILNNLSEEGSEELAHSMKETAQLLMMEKVSDIVISLIEALTEKGVISKEEITKHLIKLKDEKKQYDIFFNGLKKGC